MYVPKTKAPARQHSRNQLSRNKAAFHITAAANVSRTENRVGINRTLRYSATDVTLTKHKQLCQLTMSVELRPKSMKLVSPQQVANLFKTFPLCTNKSAP